jgi:hypothetical protein
MTCAHTSDWADDRHRQKQKRKGAEGSERLRRRDLFAGIPSNPAAGIPGLRLRSRGDCDLEVGESREKKEKKN